MIAEDEPTVALKEYLAALRDADQRFDAERDRRLSEVAVEREKALKIKEEADKAALALARADQTYKDEQANKLREQINAERNTYITTDQLDTTMREIRSLITPLTEYMSQQQGGQGRGVDLRGNLGALVGVIGVVSAIVAIVLK